MTDPSAIIDPTTIYWEFHVDRFGVRSDSTAPLGVEYARRAVHALIYWTDTIETLFGDLDEAMNTAANARLLPQYPYWSSISEAVEILRQWLGSQDELAPGESGSWRPTETRPVDGQIINPRTQDYVYQLRLYLEAMQKWIPVFSAGAWVASLAGSGSDAASPQARLLCGLKSVAAVFEFDSNMEPSAILAQLIDALGELPERVGLESNLQSGRNLIQYTGPPPEFADDPAKFYEWVKTWAQKVDSYPHQRYRPYSQAWELIEDAYWSQWSWPPAGAAVRNATATSRPPAVSALDLIYTARYGGLPLLHWRGGNLSICQWSRILAIAYWRPSVALAAPTATGLSNLGFEFSPPTKLVSGTILLSPIIMISPQSERSACWTWRPAPAIKAFARVPKALAEADRNAALADGGIGTTSLDTGIVMGSVEKLADGLDATFLNFVEVVNGRLPEASSADFSRIYWKRVAFGTDGTQRQMPPFVSDPRSVDELIQLAKRDYPEIFPRSLEGETAFARFLYRAGRSARPLLRSVRALFASIARTWHQVTRISTTIFRRDE